MAVTRCTGLFPKTACVLSPRSIPLSQIEAKRAATSQWFGEPSRHFKPNPKACLRLSGCAQPRQLGPARTGSTGLSSCKVSPCRHERRSGSRADNVAGGVWESTHRACLGLQWCYMRHAKDG